jgi:hypothetical protein
MEGGMDADYRPTWEYLKQEVGRPTIEYRLSPVEMQSRSLEGLLKSIGDFILPSAYAGGPAPQPEQLPQDKYNPRGPEVSENRFKDTLKKEGLVWVMYEYTGPRSDAIFNNLGENFWRILKQEFGGQVDGFIRINIDNWSNYGKRATDEITKPNYPAFLLYKHGSVVNEGTNQCIRIRGPPNEKEIGPALEYIKKNIVGLN